MVGLTRSQAYMDGWHAHSGNLKPSDNPYSLIGQRFSHNQWEKGYFDRQDAIKHDLSTDLDDVFGL